MSKPIVACPEKCTFDWRRFHRDLDIALAHAIEEIDFMPSRNSMMDFLTYSFEKKKLQRGATYRLTEKGLIAYKHKKPPKELSPKVFALQGCGFCGSEDNLIRSKEDSNEKVVTYKCTHCGAVEMIELK